MAGGSAGAIVTYVDANGRTVKVTPDTPLPTGAVGAGGDVIPAVAGDEYETVAAGVTNQALGSAGATGDYLGGVLIVPTTTSPGAVTIKDGAGTAIPIFAGGAGSVTSLIPFFVPLGVRSTAGAWQITTGANVSAIGVGEFS